MSNTHLTPSAADGAKRKNHRWIAGAVLFSVASASLCAAPAFAAPAPELPATFLSGDEEWAFNDTATDPSGDGSLSWTAMDFDDSAWKTGTGAFGSKRGEADLGGGFVADTLVAYSKPGSSETVPTYHFRNSFDVSASDLGQLDALDADITFDDAVRVYVNGQLAFHRFDDRAIGAENENLTYAGESNGSPVEAEFTIPAELLQEGENTIAVALYQDRESSSDIFFDFESLTPAEPKPTDATLGNIVLGVGETEQQRNLAWYSDIDVPQVTQLAKAADVSGDEFPANARVIAPTASGSTTSGEFFRDVTFDGLEESTEYAYRIGSDAAGWSETFTFRTQAFSGDFSFLFYGDPQVGASGNLASDEAGWIDTVNVSTETYPDAELLFSAGDQVNSASSEAEYDTFTAPEQLRSIPLVATNGNHDVGSKAYEQHFNVPNEDLTAGAASSGSSSGGDYWFIYKDVLFIDINSNSRDYDSHNEFMEKVIAEHGDEAKWKVLAFHHSIYSVASHVDDRDIIERRDTMPEKISELGIDMVLMGHDHNYTRTYLIKDGELADPSETEAQGKVEAKDGEVLYVTANSASGSKYYATKAPAAWYASVLNQERVRNYSAIEVTDNDITVRTLRSQANGSEMPVNSVVDEVVLTKDAAPDLTVPADSEIEIGSDFDAREGVTAIDNVDGDLTESITVSGAVDAATEGEYELTYTVSDRRGNESTATRTVTVVAAAVEEPGAEEPGTDEPGTDEPGTDEPGTDEPGTEEPGTDEPGTDEPGTDEPGTDEPGTDEPGTDEPADDQPTETPAAPVANGDDLPAALEDGILASVDGREVTVSGLPASEWSFAYLFSAPTELSWVKADGSGQAVVNIPSSIPAGEHRLAMMDENGELIGWTTIELAAADAGAGSDQSDAEETGSEQTDAGETGNDASDDSLAVTGTNGSAIWTLGGISALLLALGGVLTVRRRRA